MIKRKLNLKLLCSLIAIVFATQNYASEVKKSLLNRSKKGIPVYISNKATKELTASARDFCGYLEKMSNHKFQFTKINQKEIPKGSAILIGIPDNLKDQKKLNGDGFIIRNVGNRLYIFGRTVRGTSFAVYAFLKVLGCKWWSFSEEDIPKNNNLTYSKLNIVKDAPFKQGYLKNNEAQTRENRFFLKSRSVNSEQFTGGHTLQPMLKDYAKTHPEIYPLVPEKKGSKKLIRKFNNLHWCYTAPGIADALVKAFEKEIAKRNGNLKDWIYFAGMGDNYGGMCQCDRCKKIYKEETWTNPVGTKLSGDSATLIRMFNVVAERLEKKYPGIRIGTFAYMSLEHPPGKTKPRHNLIIRMPHLHHCIVHPVNKCKKNKSFMYSLKRWTEIAPGNVYIWDYSINYGSSNFMFPFPLIRSLGENIRYYNDIGCAGVFLQGNYVSTGGDLQVLKNYVWMKLLWNPGLKVDVLITEFCDGYYGPAANAMKKYVFLLEDAAETSEHFDEFIKPDKLKKVLLTKKLLTEAKKFINDALIAVKGNEQYTRRVKEAEVSIDAIDFFEKGIKRVITEKKGKLVVNGKYSYPEMVKTLGYSRKCSPCEWGSYLTYHRNYKLMYGGPLVTLTDNNIKVDIAPVQKGRIYQLKFKGQPLLKSQYILTDKEELKKHENRGYIMNPTVMRGSFENLSLAAKFYTIKEKSSNKAVMHGICGIKNWRSRPANSTKTIEIKENTVFISGKGEIKAHNKIEAISCTTDYRLHKGTMITIDSEKNNDGWQKVNLSKLLEEATKNNVSSVLAGKPIDFILQDINKIRITFPKRGCVLTDKYLTPEVLEIKIIYNYTRKILTTIVKFKIDKTKKNVDWLKREISIIKL